MALARRSPGREQGRAPVAFVGKCPSAKRCENTAGGQEAALAKALKSSDTYSLFLAEIHCTPSISPEQEWHGGSRSLEMVGEEQK